MIHDFHHPGASRARWLGFASPGGLDRHVAEVRALAEQGRLSNDAIGELRSRYDNEGPDEPPPGHWSAAD